MVLHILLIDDDPESLALLSQSLPDAVAGTEVRWEPCGTFEEALSRIEERRYDVVVSDIYRDRVGRKKTPATGDVQASLVVDAIRERRFCPILLFTDGVFPPEPLKGPFLQFADKSGGDADLLAKLKALIATGVPELAHRLHDELDRAGGSYLWRFLEARWDELEDGGLTKPAVLDRLVHRRASIQLGRLDPSLEGGSELAEIEGAEFYLHPPIADELRLGEIIRRQGSNEFRVVLTPHCYLVTQPGKPAPRANFVLTVKTITVAEAFEGKAIEGGDRAKRLNSLRSRILSPANFGTPLGRYWFLPGFLEMPHLYADLLQVESLPIGDLRQGWDNFAVLDAPFAEALQSCFARLYSTVGLPTVNPERLGDALDL